MSNIEPKLKQLKVADLKEILQKASVALPAKATKADLVTKILATPAAVEQFNKHNSSNGTTSETPSVPAPADNDLLSPPEQFEWESTTTTAPAPTSAQPKVAAPVKTAPTPAAAQNTVPPKPSAPAAANTTPTPTAQTHSDASKVAAADDELEKRKKRAARFGVPLVESKQQPAPKPKAAPQTTGEDPSKLQSRAARFGVPVANSGQKRPAPPVDKEEEEKRKKRAERFGNATTKTQS